MKDAPDLVELVRALPDAQRETVLTIAAAEQWSQVPDGTTRRIAEWLEAAAQAEARVRALEAALIRLHAESPPHLPNDGPCYVLDALTLPASGGES